MSRWHLIEIEDQQWCPDIVRDGATAYIARVVQLTGMLDGALPHLERLISASPGQSVIDLCSGSGGPAAQMVDGLRARGHQVSVHCTDLYPNQSSLKFMEEQSDGLSFSTQPVDATAVPVDLVGPRTLFNAFHHFRPAQARGILEDAVRANQPIAVIELVGWHLPTVLGLLGVPLGVLALVPLLRPFRWQYLPLTYILPVLPAIVQFDGLVSCLRVYTPNELRELVVGLDSFDWDIGHFDLRVPGKGTYLVGTPRREAPVG